ncbi:MAG: hypothetical protein R3326_04855, partial [Gemmatimonadota bacterium]|nr:hypothetical protein [Gemmatimonadota bacterium]
PGDDGPGDDGPGDDGSDGPDDGPTEDIDRPRPEDSDDEPDEQTCQQVRKRRDDMQIARDAFANPETVERAERNRLPGVSGDEYSYQDMIADEVGEAYDRMREARGEKATGDPAAAAMSTDASCRVSAPARSSYTDNGTPGVVWEAERWHEQVHRENCKADPDWYDDLAEDPSALSEEEVEAYDESIEVLDEYLDAKCPD